MTFEKQDIKEAALPVALVTMAILSALVSASGLIFAGVLLGASAMVLVGFGAGTAFLIPLAFCKNPQLVPPLYAMAAFLALYGDGVKKLGFSGLAGLFFAVVSGFSYSLIVYQNTAYVTLPECLLFAVFLVAIFAIVDRFSVGKIFWPAPHVAMASLLVYAMFQFDLGNVVYAQNIVTGFAMSLALGTAAYVEGKIDKGGLAVGVVLGTIIYVSLGLAGYSMLFFFVSFAVVATSLSCRLLEREDKYNLRTAGEVFANIAPSAIFALLSLFSDDPFDFIVGFCACLGSALSDTISSELGRIKEPKPFCVVTWKRCEAGDNGAVSLEGLVYGFFAAFVFGLLSLMTGLVSLLGALFVLVGAFAGNLADTWLGGTVERAGLLNNNQVNAWSSFMGGALATLLAVFYLS